MKKLLVFLLTLAVLSVFAAALFAYAERSQPSDAPTITVSYIRR